MAISYQTPTKVAYGSRTDTTFNVPAGTANGDFLILTVATANSGTAVTPTLPAGWTALGTAKTGTDGSFGWRRQKAWRVASSEPSSYTVTHSTTGCEVLCERYSGTGTLSIDTSTENNTATASQPVTGLSVTPSVINTLLSWVSLNWDLAALTPPTGMTERQDSSFIYYATQALSTTSATGNYTQTSGSGGGNPWFADMVVIKETTVSNKTLDANAGSYAVGGTAATLKLTKKVAANSGSYSVSGTAATLKRTLKTAANSGSYSITGQTASFARSWRVTANSGSYGLSGTVASLKLARRATAGAGTYSISGTAAALKTGKAIAAVAGSYSLGGATAGLLLKRILGMGSGTYSLTGSDVTLTKGNSKVVATDSGVYVLTGTAAALSKTIAIVAGSGTYTISGRAASLLKAKALAANSGSYSLSGTASAFARSYIAQANSGTYQINGIPAQLRNGDEVGGVGGRSGLWSMWLKLGRDGPKT